MFHMCEEELLLLHFFCIFFLLVRQTNERDSSKKKVKDMFVHTRYGFKRLKSVDVTRNVDGRSLFKTKSVNPYMMWSFYTFGFYYFTYRWFPIERKKAEREREKIGHIYGDHSPDTKVTYNHILIVNILKTRKLTCYGSIFF